MIQIKLTESCTNYGIQLKINRRINFAKFYEDHDDIDNANMIYERATQINFKRIEDLASVWCSWAEMHLRHKDYESAMQTIENACIKKTFRKRGDNSLAPQDNVTMSTKLWSFYADLQENFGTIETTKAAYQKMLDYKIATPQVILNYTAFLEENHYYEEAFRVFERALNLFSWPHIYDIW